MTDTRMRARLIKYPLLLSLLFAFGCAFGQAYSSSPTSICIVKGFAVGKARLHATCEQSRSLNEVPPEPPKPVRVIPMPIANCPGNYSYTHECIDDPVVAPPQSAKTDEGYVEISGGAPTTDFWSSVFDFLAMAVPAVITALGASGGL